MDLVILIIMLIIPALAQARVSSNYSKYKNEENTKKMTGFDVARKILDKNGLESVYIVETNGTLTDHYDSRRKVIRLSNEIFHGTSVASLAIAAHECGHAIQEKAKYTFYEIRTFLFPVVRFATGFSYLIIFLGLLMESLDMVWLGILLVGTGLVFQIVTLPVELDASKRAKKEIENLNLSTSEEQLGVDKMLSAAAFTYVAGVIASALEIIRLILIFTNNDRR